MAFLHFYLAFQTRISPGFLFCNGYWLHVNRYLESRHDMLFVNQTFFQTVSADQRGDASQSEDRGHLRSGGGIREHGGVATNARCHIELARSPNTTTQCYSFTLCLQVHLQALIQYLKSPLSMFMFVQLPVSSGRCRWTQASGTLLSARWHGAPAVCRERNLFPGMNTNAVTWQFVSCSLSQTQCMNM